MRGFEQCSEIRSRHGRSPPQRSLYHLNTTNNRLRTCSRGKRGVILTISNCLGHWGTLLIKHETLIQCWFNVGPALQTLVQHETSTGSMLNVCWGSSAAPAGGTNPIQSPPSQLFSSVSGYCIQDVIMWPPPPPVL